MAQKGLWNAGNKYSHSALKAKVQTRPLGGDKVAPKAEKAPAVEKPRKVVR